MVVSESGVLAVVRHNQLIPVTMTIRATKTNKQTDRQSVRQTNRELPVTSQDSNQSRKQGKQGKRESCDSISHYCGYAWPRHDRWRYRGARAEILPGDQDSELGGVLL
jgi:hypothetical protein